MITSSKPAQFSYNHITSAIFLTQDDIISSRVASPIQHAAKKPGVFNTVFILFLYQKPVSGRIYTLKSDIRICYYSFVRVLDV